MVSKLPEELVFVFFILLHALINALICLQLPKFQLTYPPYAGSTCKTHRSVCHRDSLRI